MECLHYSDIINFAKLHFFMFVRRNPTVFETGFTVFNHYILTAKLFSPVACNFILPLFIYLNPNYSVYVVIIMPYSKEFPACAVYSGLVPM